MREAAHAAEQRIDVERLAARLERRSQQVHELRHHRGVWDQCVYRPCVDDRVDAVTARLSPPAAQQDRLAALDGAWHEIEPLLPEGWRVGIYPRRLDDGERQYRVVLLRPEHGQPMAAVDGPTVATALSKLAKRLAAALAAATEDARQPDALESQG